MDYKKYKGVKLSVFLFIGTIIVFSILLNSYLLSAIGVFTWFLFLTLARTSKNLDEREEAIREKAANATYAIFAPTIAIATFIMLFPTLSKLSVFSKGDFTFLESLGTIFAYLTLFLIALYSISFFYLNKKFGGGVNEKQN